MNNHLGQGDAELHIKIDGSDVVTKISVHRMDVNHDIADVTTWGSLYREYIPVGLPKVTLSGVIMHQPAPLTAKDWAAVSGIVAAAGTDATKRFAQYDIGIRRGWLTVNDVRCAEGLGPLAAAPMPTPVAFFTAEDWATVDTIARDTITALAAQEEDDVWADGRW